MRVVSELEKGEVDLVIGWFGELPGGMRRATLYQEEQAIVAVCKPHFAVVPPQACQSALVSENSSLCLRGLPGCKGWSLRLRRFVSAAG
jgi:DNA-binding transcriptional LysR family regulator